jgi:polysaccharide export outer membrane protein
VGRQARPERIPAGDTAWDRFGEGVVVVKRSRCLRVLVGVLTSTSVVLALGACRSRRADHTADIAALVQAPASADDNPSGFEAVADKERGALPTAEEPKPYLLGVGDIVKIRVLVPTSQPMLDGDIVVPVKEDGTLSVPVAKKIDAKDKTLLEVEEQIVERLKAYVNEPVVSVEVSEYHARKCRIVGDGVTTEQFIPVNGRLTLLAALMQAGATKNPMADRDEAYLIRGGRVHTFSIAAMVGRADPSGDFVLAEGDHVVVPSLRDRQDYVYVLGQVRTPGRFEMAHKAEPGFRGRLSLMGAVGMAGGFVEGAVDCNNICVFRGAGSNLKVFHVGVTDVYRDGEAIALQPGDRVYVASNRAAQFNQALSQFLPVLSGAGTAISLGLSSAALYETSK